MLNKNLKFEHHYTLFLAVRGNQFVLSGKPLDREIIFRSTQSLALILKIHSKQFERFSTIKVTNLSKSVAVYFRLGIDRMLSKHELKTILHEQHKGVWGKKTGRRVVYYAGVHKFFSTEALQNYLDREKRSQEPFYFRVFLESFFKKSQKTSRINYTPIWEKFGDAIHRAKAFTLSIQNGKFRLNDGYFVGVFSSRQNMQTYLQNKVEAELIFIKEGLQVHVYQSSDGFETISSFQKFASAMKRDSSSGVFGVLIHNRLHTYKLDQLKPISHAQFLTHLTEHSQKQARQRQRLQTRFNASLLAMNMLPVIFTTVTYLIDLFGSASATSSTALSTLGTTVVIWTQTSPLLAFLFAATRLPAIQALSFVSEEFQITHSLPANQGYDCTGFDPSPVFACAYGETDFVNNASSFDVVVVYFNSSGDIVRSPEIIHDFISERQNDPQFYKHPNHTHHLLFWNSVDQIVRSDIFYRPVTISGLHTPIRQLNTNTSAHEWGCQPQPIDNDTLVDFHSQANPVSLFDVRTQLLNASDESTGIDFSPSTTQFSYQQDPRNAVFNNTVLTIWMDKSTGTIVLRGRTFRNGAYVQSNEVQLSKVSTKKVELRFRSGNVVATNNGFLICYSLTESGPKTGWYKFLDVDLNPLNSDISVASSQNISTLKAFELKPGFNLIVYSLEASNDTKATLFSNGSIVNEFPIQLGNGIRGPHLDVCSDSECFYVIYQNATALGEQIIGSQFDYNGTLQNIYPLTNFTNNQKFIQLRQNGPNTLLSWLSSNLLGDGKTTYFGRILNLFNVFTSSSSSSSSTHKSKSATNPTQPVTEKSTIKKSTNTQIITTTKKHSITIPIILSDSSGLKGIVITTIILVIIVATAILSVGAYVLRRIIRRQKTEKYELSEVKSDKETIYDKISHDGDKNSDNGEKIVYGPLSAFEDQQDKEEESVYMHTPNTISSSYSKEEPVYLYTPNVILANNSREK